MIFSFPPGASPLDPDEAKGLIPSHITKKSELDLLEQANILDAYDWAFRKKHKNILGEDFLFMLHKRMFQNVWKWAGNIRNSEKNIGVPVFQIRVDLKNLIENIKTWIEFNSYPPEEIAVRFHHRLVFIHPFPNGNGRHSRLATDILLVQIFGLERFTWGSKNLGEVSEVRKTYIKALKEADAGNYASLMDFVKS